ncbi:hypothetical protein VSH64_38335 [Amycolatopsis rhabdoformis]|uniref:PPE domain-containing protein n=1 Tax=Amycolatopsis rhabdoformis TaxID=1448059 RepID=A0ABZ1I575_9PSEU|nr:hypothetical protein [Amycolatopsis rhabdoformis]WSE28643.1 hypothetical protein VSH64_38335 [Amycolatopsis rhabdoformis]
MTAPQPGLEPSDADYLGHTHEQLKQFVTTNLDVNQVSSVSAAYTDVTKAFDDFATQLSDAVNKSKGSWEGSAAESAQAYFATLGTWADATAQNAKLAAQTIDDQGTAAQHARNAMTEPVPFDWTDEMGRWTAAGPFDLGDTVDKSLKKQQDSQSAHEQAAQVMTNYDQSLHEAASKQPVFADPPKFGAGEVTTASAVLPTGSGSTDHQSGGGGADSGGQVSAAPSQITGSGHVPPPAPNSATTAAAAPAAAQAPGAGAGGAGGAMPMGGMPMGGMAGGGGGFGADEEYQSKFSRGGSFGPGEGAAPGGAASGLSGAPARAGMGMGMGGGAARYEEDEADGSRFFSHVDEDSEYAGDLRAAPPVIGE